MNYPKFHTIDHNSHCFFPTNERIESLLSITNTLMVSFITKYYPTWIILIRVSDPVANLKEFIYANDLAVLFKV